METTRYRRNAGSVFSLHLHFVWCPKYRKRVLIDEVAVRFKELLEQKCNELGLLIEGLEVMPDHVHLFVSAPPTDAPQYFVNQLKGFTSRKLREEFGFLRTLLPCLWSRSYYVGSAGHVSAETIKRYIANQKERDG